MACIINADNGAISGSAGVKTTADSTGVLNIQTNGTTAISISASQAVSFTNTPTFTGGTANGVLYLNGSKVATSGSALTYDGTTFTSGAHTLSTGVLTVPAGSAAAPSITTTGDTNTGIFFPAADTIAFTEGGVESMRIDSSGNVGIGTASPGAKLEVYGGGAGTVTNAQIGNASTAFVFGVDSGNNCQIRTAQNVPIIFYTNSTERARIDSSGNLFVGGTNGNARLTVRGSGTTSATASLEGATSGGATRFLVSDDGLCRWYGTSNAETMRLDNAGNLGIGTTSPTAKLHVLNSTPNSGRPTVLLDANYGNTGDTAASLRATLNSNAGGTYLWGYTTESVLAHNMEFISGSGYVARSTSASNLQQIGGTFVFYNNTGLTSGSVFTPSERMRLDTSGNLGLGVTPSAWGSGWKAIQVGLSGALAFTGSGANDLSLSTNSHNNGTNWIYKYTGDGSARYSITALTSQHQWFVAATGTAGNTISFTQAMTLDASGNLLLGATALAFAERFRMNGGYAVFDNASYTGFIGGGTPLGTGTASDFAIRSSNALAFLTGGATERARITSGGNFELGTNAGTGTRTLTIQTNTSGDPTITLSAAGADSGSFWFERSTLRLYARASNTGGVYLASGGTSWTAVSDERKKDIIEPISNAAEKVASLRAVVGKYKTDKDGVRRSFLIAQDVQAVFPEAIDASDENELGLSYTDTIPLLVAAIKELTARVAELETK